MSDFPIESNIPIPSPNRGHHPAPRRTSRSFSFEQMAPGDSFLVPTASGGDSARSQTQICSAAKNWIKSNPQRSHITFTTRSLPEGIRIWRIT